MRKKLLELFVEMDRKDRISSGARRRFLATAGGAGAAALAGCTDFVTDDGDADDGTPTPDPDADVTDLSFQVPRAIEDGEPVFGDELRFREFNDVVFALGMVGSACRTNEMSHENYDLELREEFMAEVGDRLVEAFELVNDAFADDNAIRPALVEESEGWSWQGEPDLEDYAHAVYAYHPHHRGIGRWGRVSFAHEEAGNEELAERYDDLNDDVTFRSAPFVSLIGEYVLNERYEDGQFHDADGKVTAESMAHGLGAVNGHYYAWVRRNSPDGLGDGGNMGLVTRDVLEAFLGYDEAELGEIALEIVETLDEYWDEDVGAYDFGNGPEYGLVELGALLRGHKTLYEFLYIENEPERGVSPALEGMKYEGKPVDRDAAETLVDRTATMLGTLLDSELAQPWGLPDVVRYTEDGIEAAAGTTAVATTWKFINEVNGGWTVGREREGEDSPLLLSETHPDVWEGRVDLFDLLLEGAVDDGYHLDDDGYVITELDYETGDVTDDRYTASALALFLTATENIYRTSTYYTRAANWDDVDPAVAERSEAFYDTMLRNYDLLEESFIVED